MVCKFYFIDAEKIIKDQQTIINKTLGLEIIGSDIITSDDIMIPSTPIKPNLKVSRNIYLKFHIFFFFFYLCFIISIFSIPLQ